MNYPHKFKRRIKDSPILMEYFFGGDRWMSHIPRKLKKLIHFIIELFREF